MLNKVQLIGWLGKNPDVYCAHDEHRLCVKFDLATHLTYKERGKGWVKKTEWHRVTLFGRPAEYVRRYLRKGAKVYVEGRLQTQKWEDNGVDRYHTEIICSTLLWLDGQEGSEDAKGSKGSKSSDTDEGSAPHAARKGEPRPATAPAAAAQAAPAASSYAARRG